MGEHHLAFSAVSVGRMARRNRQEQYREHLGKPHHTQRKWRVRGADRAPNPLRRTASDCRSWPPCQPAGIDGSCRHEEPCTDHGPKRRDLLAGSAWSCVMWENLDPQEDAITFSGSLNREMASFSSIWLRAVGRQVRPVVASLRPVRDAGG